ncbi:cupin domain-containing protein [Halocatena pleomorpha]|uniref:Cupin domain-containing protein n=1 Tax=Halocatena pleomorpha TaxID=1785090 RepID=A0A3P3R4R0_9EURY|nr:cupin domain-containing protein [Halocatena pleomorpha]RRJ28324.1 cupin domain-containing protein [Halocatena pleomorpha]
MSVDKVNYHDVEPVGDAMHFLREPLGCEQLGLTVVECEPGWTGKEHDHGEQGEEEVYLLLDGNATIVADGEEIALESGDALRLSPDTTRQIQNGDTESTFVLAGAP